ncbi:MAG: hypothetical protein P4L22_03070 [Candidatus Babeliales bacterium]|nr:hypothetical protein [Candidatus Babeliales bacterium]
MNNNLKILALLPLFFVFQVYTKAEVCLNVFIHGIIKTPFTIYDFEKIAHNCVEGSQHYHMVDYLRQRTELYSYQPMQKKGLIKIDPQASSNGAAAIAKLYHYQFNSLTSARLDQHNQKSDIYNLYYTFGWSGYLSRLHRQRDAKKLYNALKNEVNDFKKKGIDCKIRLIGFSHAGNLILSMAKGLTNKVEELPFIIDELIVLAVPIQKETDKYIHHPIFKKIYSFYSMSDIAPKADFFSTKYLFSHRRFGRKDLPLPDKLTQIKFRTTHVVFNKCGNIEKQYHVDPNHMEFWNFGWAPRSHREKFPLKPFSIISLVPYFINAINSIENLSGDIVLDVVPKLEKLIITDNTHSICELKKEYSLPFISNYDFNEMKKICLKYKTRSELCKFNKRNLVKNAMRYATCKRYPSASGCSNCDYLLNI